MILKINYKKIVEAEVKETKVATTIKMLMFKKEQVEEEAREDLMYFINYYGDKTAFCSTFVILNH